jgi:hypothetical protein
VLSARESAAQALSGDTVTEQAKRAYEAYAAKAVSFVDGSMGPMSVLNWEDAPDSLKECWRAAVVAAVDQEPAVETLTDKQVRLLHEVDTARVARKLTELLPPGQGFILLTFDFGPGGNLAYVSNANRDDAIRALREWLVRQGAL